MPRVLFSVTLFLSAFLLFLMQPLVGRLLLPVLGGSAAVWTTCLVFFQTVLLAGYLWSHLMSRMSAPVGRALYVLTLLAGCLVLPLGLGGLLVAPTNGDPTRWLLQTMFTTVGLPFFALASNAPTLQQWFSDTDDPSRGDPYFLYGASNIGSLLGLLAYPFVFEPLLPLTAQRQLWSAGYAMMPLLIIGCLVAARGRHQPVRADVPETPASKSPGRLLRWVGLAFVPSSLTAGVTAYVSTELAPVPLLWVLPLGLYLLSFVQAFAGRGCEPSDKRIRFAALIAFPLAAWHVTQTAPTWVLVTLHLGALYVIALLCHSRLYAERPGPSRLTGFYLWIAVGGALGGFFNAILAPRLFVTAAEYSLVLMLAAFWLGPTTIAVTRWLDVTAPRLVAGMALVWLAVTSVPNPSLALLLPAGQIARQAFGRPRVRAVATFVLGMLFVRFTVDAIADDTYVVRSFFAVHRVVDEYRPGYRALIHGATLHGMQRTGPGDHRQAVTYFTRKGPIGQVFGAHEGHLGGAAIGVVGLGAGELASYATVGQRWTFFEIDPVVERIARERFGFLSGAPVAIEVALGDGRVSLGRSSSRFDLLIMDAFSSDAIPRHLITVEAFQLYFNRLMPNGVIALHISNRFVDLEPTLARLAQVLGLAGLIQFDSPAATEDGTDARLSSSWVVLARRTADLGGLARDSRWRRLQSDGAAPWTDEKADILSAIRWPAMSSLAQR